MEFNYNDDEGVDNFINTEIQCNYVSPDEHCTERDELSVMCFNIQSMNTKWDRFKSELLSSEVSNSVMGFCETHLIDAYERLYTLDGYELFTSNVASNKGGVCLYAQHNLNSKLRADLVVIKEYIETIFIDCIIKNKTITIGRIYHHPGLMY